MKFSINQGPFVCGKDYKFTISVSYVKEISNFFWDWYNSLPKEVANHIEVITVNPANRLFDMHEQISIKVILSGNFLYHYQDGGKEQTSWKNQLEEILFCLPFQGESIKDTKSLELLNVDLNKKIRDALMAEIKTYQPLLSELNSMLNSMAVRY